jgi:pyridoxine 5-phosphate synthase
MNRAILGINIDHIATLRQARDESYPEISKGAEMALASGADQITIHLREDRRHIQDKDVPVVREITKKHGKILNLEMATAQDIFNIALANTPDWICFVPEKREEKTTEGGLNLLNEKVFQKHQTLIQEVRTKLPQTKVSLFLAPDLDILEQAKLLQCDAVEIHTGHFCHAFESKDHSVMENELIQIGKAYEYLVDNEIRPHAGHGFTLESLEYLAKRVPFIEYNIGHWIISQSVFDGLEKVIKDTIELLDKYKIK